MKNLLLISLCGVVSVLQGCGFISPYLEVIQPPALTETQKHIVENVEEQLPSNATLIQTNTARHSSKYHFFDLNTDGKDELIVFYYEKERDYLIHMGIFKNIQNYYVLKQTIQTSHTNLDEVTFIDINNDNSAEILLSFPNNREMADNKIMMIYELSPEKGYNLADEKIYYSFSYFDNVTTQMTQLIFVESDAHTTTVSLNNFKNSTIELVDSISLPFGKNSIIQVTHGKFNENTYGVSVDNRKTNNMFTPNLILVDGNTLKNQLEQEDLFKKWNIGLTNDFDLDNIYEFPIVLQGSSQIADELNYPLHLLLQWREMSENNVYHHEQTIYYNLTEKYLVKLPPTYETNVYFEQNGNSFKLLEKGTNKLLFHLIRIPISDNQTFHYQTILGERDDYMYVSPMESSKLEGQFYFMTNF